jgi:hypothetical protein
MKAFLTRYWLVFEAFFLLKASLFLVACYGFVGHQLRDVQPDTAVLLATASWAFFALCILVNFFAVEVTFWPRGIVSAE